MLEGADGVFTNMKKAIKRLLTKKYAIHPKQLIPLIERADCKIVSFDIFDTLIKRNVPAPKDVFFLLEEHYQKKFERNLDISGLRAQAEASAVQHENRRDVTFEEIYQAIEGISEKERQWLMAEEIRIEHAVCQRWMPMGEVYDWCMEHGIPVILVSDMYLPRTVIAELLHEAGYTGWKYLYISVEEQCNKAKGTLFDTVLSREGLKPVELLHIGDSLRGEYLVQREKGILSFLIIEEKQRRYQNKKVFLREEKQGRMSYRIIDSLVKNNIDQYDGFYRRLGYAVVGPILYGYCKWLAEQIKAEQIEKVFFLAREGYLLKRGFDLLNTDSIRSKVIQVSRKAVKVPRLHQAANLSELLEIIKVQRESYYTVSRLLLSCGIEKPSIIELLQKQGFQPDDIISEMTDEKKGRLFQSIRPLIDKYSHEQERNIRGYMAQCEMYGKIAVCDVGWHGTIQYELQEIFSDVEIEGFYIGATQKHIKETVPSRAYLFDDKCNQEIGRVVAGTFELFEVFFLSTDGSANSYEQDAAGNFVCRLLPPEQTVETAQCIIELQDAACAFIQDFKRVDDDLNIEVSPSAASAGYCAFVTGLNGRDMRELHSLSFLNVVKRSLVAEHSLGWYIVRPRYFISEFMSNGSKALFLKDVFKVPFPYVWLVDWLKRRFP